MASQNLTPQLRTRLSRMERLVGVFVAVATLLFLLGLGYYVYQTAKRKGWFLTKAQYFTFVDNAAGIRIGDKVMLMGFDVGEVTGIEAMPPFDSWNVFVEFEVREPYYGYLWTDSRAQVASTDFLGGRTIEVTKGIEVTALPTFVHHQIQTLGLADARKRVGVGDWVFNVDIEDAETDEPLVRPFQPLSNEALDILESSGVFTFEVFNRQEALPGIAAVYDDKIAVYKSFGEGDTGYFLPPDESPALQERLEKMVNQVESTLPNVLDITNQINLILTNVANVTRRTDLILASAQPVVTNLAVISGHLSNPDGSLGQWLLPTNIRHQAESTLAATEQAILRADRVMLTVETNLGQISAELLVSLESLASMTSNLNAQVHANRFLLGDVASLIRNTDDMVQGLKRNWLLKGSFEDATNKPPGAVLEPRVGGAP